MRMYGCDEHPLELPRFVLSEYSNKECHPVWESPAEQSIRGWKSQLIKWEAGEGISLPLVVLGPRTVEARDYDPKGYFVACKISVLIFSVFLHQIVCKYEFFWAYHILLY